MKFLKEHKQSGRVSLEKGVQFCMRSLEECAFCLRQQRDDE